MTSVAKARKLRVSCPVKRPKSLSVLNRTSPKENLRMYSMGKNKDVSTPRICDFVWRDGEFIKWDDARVHVMSHVLHYGSSVFEGIRCYATKRGPAIFRLREHMQRFLNSAKIYRMGHDWSLDDFCNASTELVLTR